MRSRLKDETPRYLREKAKLLLKDYATDLLVDRKKATIGSMKDLNFVPKMVVFRHSHFLDRTAEKGEYVYANTGSWRRTLFVDHQGRMMKIQNHCPYIEVFPPVQGGLPRAIHRRAVDGKEIDLNDFFKDYKEFGLALGL